MFENSFSRCNITLLAEVQRSLIREMQMLRQQSCEQLTEQMKERTSKNEENIRNDQSGVERWDKPVFDPPRQGRR